MKIIIESRGKRYEVVRCGSECSFCKFDSADERCSKRCYAPMSVMNAVRRLAENGVGLKLIDEVALVCANCMHYCAKRQYCAVSDSVIPKGVANVTKIVGCEKWEAK